MTNVVLKWSKAIKIPETVRKQYGCCTLNFILHRVRTVGGRANDTAGTDNVYNTVFLSHSEMSSSELSYVQIYVQLS